MKSILILFTLLTLNSFSQEIGDKNFINVTLEYVRWIEPSDIDIWITFIDSNSDTTVIFTDEWRLDDDMLDFALINKGNSFRLTLEYDTINIYGYIEGFGYGDTGETREGWTLINLEDL